MNRLTTWLKWLDNNVLKLLIIFFIFLIPLYPKFPLKFINYTYVAIRLEDVYVGFLFAIFVIQLIRKKVALKKEFLIAFFIFWGAVFLSYLFGVFVSKTVVYRQVGLLHSLRRVEYMSIFFIALSTVKNKKDFIQYLYMIFFVMVLVVLYAFGQKFLGLPAVQTMNAEFAKGYILYLTPEARVSSTFSGHYDLAAYLVFLIPVLLSFFIFKRKFIFFIAFILALLTLNLTASRISFIAYAVTTISFLVFIRKFKLLFFVLVITAVTTAFSGSLISRFFKTFQIKQIFVNQNTGQVIVPQKITTKELPAGSFYIPIDKDIKESDAAKRASQKLAEESILNDIRKDASREGRILTASEEAQMTATGMAELKKVNTVVSDISFATRLQVEWPRAIKAFFSNPLLGTGPSSITEATDNDYLRWIGEFGLIGTLAFFYIIFMIAFKSWQIIRSQKEERVLYAGFLFGLAGLLMNATYIDVFEASKVAFNFWLLAGIFIGAFYLVTSKKKV